MEDTEKYDLFISYRRDGGLLYANILQQAFLLRGFKVFFDYSSLRNGKFDEKIYQAISECKYVILVLSKGCLDRCSDPSDWVRHEIEFALSKGKTIVPVSPDDGERNFPATTPSSFGDLPKVQISVLHMDDTRDKSIDLIIENRFDSRFVVERSQDADKEKLFVEKVRAYQRGDFDVDLNAAYDEHGRLLKRRADNRDVAICKALNEYAEQLGIPMSQRILLLRRVECEKTDTQSRLDDLFGKSMAQNCQWADLLTKVAAGKNRNSTAETTNRLLILVLLALVAIGILLVIIKL